MQEYKIYPKQFQFDKVMVQKNKCFMIMPFDEKFNCVYATITETAEKNQVICFRADEMNGSQPIVNKIIKGILESQYIIVDITDAKPNVFYELGIAHSFRDARNILIIKQRDTQYPFDISHLPYQEYDPNNIFRLKTIISTFIKESRYITDFRDALALNDIYDYTINGDNNYIEYIENYFAEKLSIYSDILNQNTASYEEAEIEKAFVNYENLVGEIISTRKEKIIDGIIQIYIKLITRCEIEGISKKYALRFDDRLLQFGMNNDDSRIAKETDLMLALANDNKLLDLCLPWIIGYFSKSKSSSIDLNRYKLEHFLMNSDNENVNEAIINSIYNEDCHIREHMADIIGAKVIQQGFYALKTQLMVEENWFTIGSIVEAIGRVATSEDGLPVIEKWIAMNGQRMIEEKQFFLLKHLFHALLLLDSNNGNHADEFLKKYKKYMHENQVGAIN